MLENPLWQQYSVTEEKARGMFTKALACNATIFTAKKDGQTAGFVWFMTHGAWDRSGYIRLIGVSPRFQGHTIGAQLMAAAETEMFKTVQDVFLLVTASNTSAQRFYEKLGYARVGAIPDYVCPGITELIYRKRLQQKDG